MVTRNKGKDELKLRYSWKDIHRFEVIKRNVVRTQKTNLSNRSTVESKSKSKCLLSHAPNCFSAAKFLGLGRQHLRSRRHRITYNTITYNIVGETGVITLS